ncbi:MAG: hypothetical protein AUJ52_09540 [Elusimicrobia bacterium CG1_02_63_36]|nr:MAG: hypothetical protein AUJ52_09540 [Elusimicrobia bacterium CG1_02_63_36]PJA11439.1 MAG: hypothetical protein COX66_19925 [Elusimicrobia bacterium CG_4_10_14_0_2_um_filter_63_34]
MEETLGEPVLIDPFSVDDNLHAWASRRVLARGTRYYRDGRVVSLDSDGREIRAEVRGETQRPYQVEIHFDACSLPQARCSCPFDWEPMCKHAVAALLAWQQAETGSEPDLGEPPPAADEPLAPRDPEEREGYLRELAERERKEREARSMEQGLRIVACPKGLLGAYRVASGDHDRGPSAYRVIVRDAAFAHASCECVDFRVNELGTCKHVERVKRALASRPKRRLLADEERRSKTPSAYLGPRQTHRDLPGPTEAVRFHLPPGLGAAASDVSRALDTEGFMRNGRDPVGQKRHFERLVRRLDRSGAPVRIDPAVRELLNEEARAHAWENRVERIAKSPPKSRDWRESAGRMRVRLHRYQREGILFAAKKRRAFIGDDMGLGKTVQAIGTALLLKRLAGLKRTLVICPASLKLQWRHEIEKTTGERARVIAGPARERARLYGEGSEFFFIVNYELLYRDLDQVLGLGAELVILDEAQRIKNWDTKIARAIKRLKSPHRLVLTGTPLENRLAELQSIMEFLDPRALGAPWKLMPTYARVDDEGRVTGYENLDHLRARLGRRLIRRTRAEVLTQLPGRTDNVFWTPITPEQADVHNGLLLRVNRLMNKFKKYKRLTREDLQLLFMLLTTMRIVSNAYGQYEWKPLELDVLSAPRLTPALKEKIRSPKLEEFRRVMADLLDEPGRKVVVFSSWERMIRLADLYIRDLLAEKNAESVVFCGSVSQKKRAALIRRFTEDPACRVFFSTDSGSVGLNLQDASNTVVNLEIPWNPAVLEQRVGRVHRMGQKRSVAALHFVSADSIESRIFELAGQKRALFSGLFDKKLDSVRFSPDQASSFMDKMRMLFPETAAQTEADDAESEGAAQEPAPEASADDSVAAVAEPQDAPAPAAPALEFDLAPAAKALAALGAPTVAADERVPLKVRVAQEEGEFKLTVPRAAVELLKSLKPLLAVLAKLGG